MKAYAIEQGVTGLQALRAVELADPKPEPTQILLRIRATSLNYRDILILNGRYGSGQSKRDTIPLSDGAGEVVAVGKNVTRFKPGDRAAGTFFQNWVDGLPTASELRPALGAGIDGMLAEFVAVEERDAVALPPSLTFEEAATLPCAGVTAWNALMHAGRPVRPGDIVLVQGTGGVSILALQFARAAGARVIATSSSDEKLARAKALGATDGVNYRTHPDWEKEVLSLTKGRGVDCVVEVGGIKTLPKSMDCVAYSGKIAMIGVLSGFEGSANPHPVMRKGAHMHGIMVGNRAMFEAMNAAIETNGIKPAIDKVFPFADAAKAYAYQEAQSHFGKVIIGV